MGNFHYDDTSVVPGSKSQPPATVRTDQAPRSTVRSGFSSAHKTLTPPTADDTQPSQSAQRCSDPKQHPPPATRNNKRSKRHPGDLKSAENPVPPPSVDSNSHPLPVSQDVQLDTPSQANATPNNAQKQGHHHAGTRRGSTHYDIRVVNLTYNVTPPQTPQQAQAVNPKNGQHPRARSQPVNIDDAPEQSSRDKKATASAAVQVFCSLVFFAGLVNLSVFAYFFEDHKVVGLLVLTCLMTGVTLLDMVNAFCTKSRCWYALSFCFWVPTIVIWTAYLIYYSLHWARECPIKDGGSQCLKLIVPVWVFNVPLFLLVLYYAVSLRDAACSND